MPIGQVICKDCHYNRYQNSAKMTKKLMPKNDNKSILRTASASMLAAVKKIYQYTFKYKRQNKSFYYR